MDVADKKILKWMLKGSPEFNDIARCIDLKLLKQAVLPKYKNILGDITDYYSKYKSPPSYEVLSKYIIDRDELSTLSEIQEVDCQNGESGFYLSKIKERYNLFLIQKIVEDMQLISDEVPLEDINQNFRSLVSKIERLNKESIFSEGRISDSVQDRIDTYNYTKENPNKISGILSGYRELDEYIFGIKKSELMMIVGASSSGKSMLMLNMGVNAWLGSNDPSEYYGQEIASDGKNVVYISLEMSKAQLEARVDCILAKIKHKSLSRGFLDGEELERWERSLNFQKAYKKNFYVVDMPRNSRTMDIEARLESISAEFEIDVLIIDYIGIMKPNTDYGSDWLEVGQVSADVHELCRRRDIPVISAAQKKGRDKKANKSYNDTEEIGRSKMIGDNSTIVLIIETRDEELLLNDMVIHISKNRDGEKGIVYLEKEFEKSRINNFSEDWVKDTGDENAH